MSEYEFNAERFCRVRARTARTVRNFDDEANFLKVAERVRQLEYEVEVWKNKPSMNVQRKYDALLDACRPVACAYVTAKNNVKWSGETIKAEDMAFPGVTVAQMDALAALVGEEGK